MVNFKKLRAEAIVFEEIERCRNGAKIYFKPIQKYIDFLNEEWTVLEENDLMAYSTKCEPKGGDLDQGDRGSPSRKHLLRTASARI